MKRTLLAAIVLTAVASAASNVTVNQATFDGTCFYPKPDPNFPGLSTFMGRWFQVAGTATVFEAGCDCVTADYALNQDGSVNVTNTCKRFGLVQSRIDGVASPVDAAYGAAALQVRFSSVPGGGVVCPGPNYIVQKYEDDWAIVQSPAFSTLFLLSRIRQPPEADMQSRLDEAEALGSSMKLVTRFRQDNCD